MLFPGTTLTVDIVLADHVHVNANCSLAHDVRIGAFSTLSPRTTICGRVQIGSGVFVGAGTCIVNGSEEQPIAVGDNARIAAGSVVIAPVDANTFVAGVPAISLKELITLPAPATKAAWNGGRWVSRRLRSEKSTVL